MCVWYLQGFKRELDVIGLFQVHVVHQQLTGTELHEHGQQLHTQTHFHSTWGANMPLFLGENAFKKGDHPVITYFSSFKSDT